jgi:hypothetical protein
MTGDDLASEIARAEAVLARAKIAAGMTATGGSSSVTFNAGGVGVIASIIASAIMLGLNLGLSIVIIIMYVDSVKQDAKVTAMQDYINAIYVAAPSLKPENINGQNHRDNPTAETAPAQSPEASAQEKEVTP